MNEQGTIRLPGRGAGAEERVARRHPLNSGHGLLPLGLAVVCVALLARRVDLAAAAPAVREAGWEWVLPAALLGGAGLIAHGVRWWLLVRRAGHVPLVEAVGMVVAAGGLGSVLPMRAATVMQVQVMHRRYGIGRTAVAGTLVAEALLDAAVVVPLALVLAPALGLPRGVAAVLVGTAAAGVLVAAAAIGVIRCGLVPGVRWLPDRTRRRLSAIARDVAGGFRALGSPVDAVMMVLLTLASWLLPAVAYAVAGHALGLAVSPLAFLAIEITANLAGAVPLTQANLGTYEVAVGATLIHFGARAEQAAAFAVAAHMLALAGTVFTGIVAAWLLRLGRADFFHIN